MSLNLVISKGILRGVDTRSWNSGTSSAYTTKNWSWSYWTAKAVFYVPAINVITAAEVLVLTTYVLNVLSAQVSTPPQCLHGLRTHTCHRIRAPWNVIACTFTIHTWSTLLESEVRVYINRWRDASKSGRYINERHVTDARRAPIEAKLVWVCQVGAKYSAVVLRGYSTVEHRWQIIVLLSLRSILILNSYANIQDWKVRRVLTQGDVSSLEL